MSVAVLSDGITTQVVEAGGGGEGGQHMVELQGIDDTHVIMLVNDTGGHIEGSEIKYVEGAKLHLQAGNQAGSVVQLVNQASQTETVFGLKDLPFVREIVSKKIASTKLKKKEEAKEEFGYGPVHGIYTCTICARVYRNKISWQNHLLSHNGSEVLMCGVCGQLFHLKLTLRAHLDMHLREEKKLRSRQEKHFATQMKVSGVYLPGDTVGQDEVVAHKVTANLPTEADMVEDDHDEPQVAATEEVVEGGGEGEDMEPLTILENTENEEPVVESGYIYACNICGQQYSVKADCEKHLRVHSGYVENDTSPANKEQKPAADDDDDVESPPRPPHDTKTPNKTKFSAYIYACNVCGKQYTNKSNCKRHMRIHTDEEKNYECEFCQKRFSQKYEVRMHARIHTGEKPYSCAVCGKNFTERGNWRRHTQIHVRPHEASPYRCGICCKGFFHAEKLQVHLQIHSGQRPFVCTVCGRHVKKIGDMYRHLRTHTGERPYKCQICDKGFIQNIHLKLHMKTHGLRFKTKAKSVCGKGFAQNGNLKDHLKVHTGEKPHDCDLCDKSFSRKVLLKEHVKHHHKGSTLKDLTEAALEEIERQEAEMEEGLEVAGQGSDPVVHELGHVSHAPQTFVVKETGIVVKDEQELLQQEQELEMQEITSTLTEKELEAAHVLTVVQDGDNMVYTVDANSKADVHLRVTGSGELEVQNS